MKLQVWMVLMAAAALAATGRGEMVERLAVPEGAALATWNVNPSQAGEVVLSWDGAAERVAFPKGTSEMSLKRTPRGWFLHGNNEPLWERWGGVTTNAVTVSHDEAALPQGEQDEYVQKLAPFAFSDGFMVAEGTALPQHWEVVRGRWTLGSVTNSFEAANRRQQNVRQPTPEKSPNYYCAQGSGHDALALTGETFHEHYMLRASVQHNAGRNGIAFMATDDGKFFTLAAETDPVTERVNVALRRHDGGQWRVLDKVFTELRPGQWMLMEVRVTDDEVRGFVDNIEVLRVKCALPAGGRYGLYADNEMHEPTRFDDVECVSHEDYALNTSEAMERMTAGTRGFEVIGPEDARCWEKPEGVYEAWRSFGTTEDLPHLLSVRFLVRNPYEGHYSLALQSGGYTFAAVLWHHDYSRMVRLLHDGKIIAEAEVPWAQGKFTTLTLDTSREGEVRGLVNGKLALLHKTREMPSGEARIYVQGEGTAILHNTPTYTTLAPEWVDRVEKNTQYTTDPFMRHWASAEGQWHINQQKETWLRGDTLGRVRVQLPVTPNATLWLGLDEESSTNADARVELRDGRLRAYLPGAPYAEWSVPLGNLPETHFEQPRGSRALYTVGLEDHVLWAACATGMLASVTLPDLPRGRRVRLEGVPLDELRFSRVRRENVFDSLFNESLYAWILNGGQWETVARFQCDPTWSHMNGENKDGLAALWGKYEFTGDFSIEFFAGMRMGWYERGGDLNITVMNHVNSPASGYTITATGWDPDNSQSLTRLFRDGVEVANTTAYAVPRNREGQLRKAGYEPLVAGGRDMHGAWYGMRLRRVGDALTYLFDNEPLLAWRDPEPIPAGGFGIWTFQNSMMVARARIVAEGVKPRAFKVWRQSKPAPAPAEPLPSPDGLRVGGLPPNLLTPANWKPADPVSHPLATYFQNGFRATSTASGGTFLMRANRATFPAANLLGFDFEFAFAPGTLANFEFSSGSPGNGALEDSREWSQPLTGTRERRGKRLVLPPPEKTLQPSHDPGTPVWNRVTVWLPSTVLSAKNHHIQLDGFGNLQPSDIQQGLMGNLPGAWYAVRNFRPVWNGAPVVTSAGNGLAVEEFQEKIHALPPGKLHTMEWPKAFSNPPLPAVMWAVPAVGEFELEAAPEPGSPGLLRVRSAAPWNSPLLPPKKAVVNDRPATFAMRQNDALVIIPSGVSGPSFQLDLTCADGRIWRVKVPTAPPSRNEPPRLAEIEASAGKYLYFNSSFYTRIPAVGNAPSSITPAVPGRGNVLTIANKGAYRRLDTVLDASYDPVATPLIQFGYSGTPSSAVTLSWGANLLR
ncbi:MAG: hypothetical protein FWF96_04085, partial [Kiritimatiellaeota bacterium]|nr:hypothetical protein [Kiritimatiellota bacterium]